MSLQRDSLRLNEFIQLVEADYHLRFYYNPSWIKDSLKSNVNYDNVELLSAVEDYFEQFGLGIYADLPVVYITRGEVLKEEFARDFYESLSSRTPVIQEFTDTISEEDAKEGLTGSGFEMVQFGIPSPNLSGNKFYIRGVVLDAETGQSIIGATVQIAGTLVGTVTDIDGNYGLVIPSGQNEILYRAVGKKTARRLVTAYENGKIDISLADEFNMIDQVTIIGQFNDRVNRMDGSEQMNMLVLNKSIMILGETDILKGLLTLPGVNAASEITTGYNVRGGSTDQNLVLLDDAPIMNMSHFFGFFSNINADVVQDAELYKSGIPSTIGGRISSILDMASRTGDYEKYSFQGGISPISARLTVDGPILKDRISFIAAGRSTYSDWILSRVGDERVRNSSASFYDIFGKVSMKLKENKDLFLTLYTSHDYFRFDKFQTQEYSNFVVASGYNSQLGKNLFYKATLSFSSYNFSLTDESLPFISAISSYNINQYSLNNRFKWQRSRWLNFRFGINGLLYDIQPGSRDPRGTESIVEPLQLDNERAIEGSLYIQNEQTINSWLTLSYGLRYSAYGYLGPGTIFGYYKGITRSLESLKDTSMYSRGELIKLYSGPEFRFLGKIRLDARSSFKFSYDRTRQYIGLVSNTVLPAPTDFWKLSNPLIQPKIGDIVSVGFFRNIVLNPANTFMVSLEAYYRNTENILDYKTGAELFANTHFETEIIQGINRSYGIEFQISRDKGDLTGWLNYAYARSLNRFLSILPEETINNGLFFPANYDKPHQMNLVANYDIYRRFRISTNVFYSTGRPITLPETAFYYRGSKRIQFSDRNLYRLSDFFRVDLTVTAEGNYRVDKPVNGSVSFSVVNVTGRKNPYSIFFDYNERGRLKAYSLSIYGVPIFTLTYNFKF
ncbi:carboxypeptidase-like regulatory domain-containing protein [Bacteroidota bacterium]